MRNRRALTCAADAAEIDAAPLNIASHTDGVDGKTLARLELEDPQAHLGLPGDTAEQVKCPKASPVVLQPTHTRTRARAWRVLARTLDRAQTRPVECSHARVDVSDACPCAKRRD